MLPCCLFLKIRKSKLSFRSSTCASCCWCRGTFLACTKISSDWFCKAETRNRARYRLRMWKGMRYVQKRRRKKWEQSLKHFWEYLNEETWEDQSWKGTDSRIYVRYWNDLAPQKKDWEDERWGNRKLRYTEQELHQLCPHLSSHLGWLIMMRMSVRLWDFAPHLYPFRKASPLETGMSPVSILNVVVFPAPLIPSSPKHWRTQWRGLN